MSTSNNVGANGSAHLRGAIEALLFVSDEPVSAARLSEIVEASPSEVDTVLVALAEELRNAERGFQLREVAGGWRMYTSPTHHEIVERYILSWDTRRLSQAALETLAVIAYHQPVTRNGINSIRGVNSEGVISSLIEKGLVREVGRDRSQNNAIIYATTRTFLEKFGLRDISELPPLDEFAPEQAVQMAIKDRLGMGGGREMEEAEIGSGDSDDDEFGVTTPADGSTGESEDYIFEVD